MAVQYSRSQSADTLAPPPPGIIPNLINPTSRAYQLYAVCSVFLALMVFSVAVRLYAKWVLLKMRTWDDCTAFSHFLQLRLTRRYFQISA